MIKRHLSRLAPGILMTLLTVAAIAEENGWPRWRGPHGLGHSHDRNIPLRWKDSDITWSVDLPGRGQSSPIAWNNLIFLTCAEEKGRTQSAICLDARDGRLVWKRSIENEHPEKLHAMNSWATPTCATDGEYVAAFFGNGGLVCYDITGKMQWRKDFGQFETAGWGMASSPVFVNDMIVQVCDADNTAFLVAYEKKTGKEVWKTERPKARSFTTPLLIETDSRPELVMNGHSGIESFDPRTGQKLWHCYGGSGRGTPSVVMAEGMVIAISGRSRGDGDMMAVRPGGSGDVSGSHLVWHTKRGGRDLPSPIVVGKYIVTVNLRPGLAACQDLATGKTLWQQRMGTAFSASPICVNGMVYCLSETGEVMVIKPGPVYKEVARNRVPCTSGEVFRASMMPYNGQLYCRSNIRIYCIGSKVESSK